MSGAGFINEWPEFDRAYATKPFVRERSYTMWMNGEGWWNAKVHSDDEAFTIEINRCSHDEAVEFILESTRHPILEEMWEAMSSDE